jgi:glutamate synthase domain-containing protein 3
VPLRISYQGVEGSYSHLAAQRRYAGRPGGALLAEGRAGQRFGVRMSGGLLMCEGTGKYAFEYMTGGLGVVLGPTGPVVSSGMTGGTVYLLDEDGLTAQRVHADARVAPLAERNPEETETLRGLVIQFARETGSRKAAALLADWPAAVSRFLVVGPR